MGRAHHVAGLDELVPKLHARWALIAWRAGSPGSRRSPSRPSRGVITLHYETVVPAALDTTFAFFADAANLERLTPPWVHFRIATLMPVVMREGLEIDYRIVVRGLPLGWRSRIDVWAPNRRFVDRQVLGPYRWWHHEHRFEPVGGGTRVIDEVEFVPRAQMDQPALRPPRCRSNLQLPASDAGGDLLGGTVAATVVTR